jgi:hypothetical protein
MDPGLPGESDFTVEVGRAEVPVDSVGVPATDEPESQLVRVLPEGFEETDEDGAPIIVRKLLSSGYTWVVASLPDREEAESRMVTYMAQGFPAEVFPAEVRGRTYYRVTIGEYETRAEARRARGRDLPPDAPTDTWLFQFNRP